MNLKDIRKEKGITQQQASTYLGVSLRSYKSYENDTEKKETRKYRYLVEQLSKYNQIDEENGILSLKDIKKKCQEVLNRYDVEYCILFGSYSKSTAQPSSDVDLLISTSISGLRYYSLVEDLRTTLKKRVDVLTVSQLKNNYELTCEILRDGIKIYG